MDAASTHPKRSFQRVSDSSGICTSEAKSILNYLDSLFTA
jgi:hypothetical protein